MSFASLSGLFAVPAFLEPADVSEPTGGQRHYFNERVRDSGGYLPSHSLRDDISEFRPSQTSCKRLFPNHETLTYQILKVQPQRVMANSRSVQQLKEDARFAILKRAQNGLINRIHETVYAEPDLKPFLATHESRIAHCRLKPEPWIPPTQYRLSIQLPAALCFLLHLLHRLRCRCRVSRLQQHRER